MERHGGSSQEVSGRRRRKSTNEGKLRPLEERTGERRGRGKFIRNRNVRGKISIVGGRYESGRKIKRKERVAPIDECGKKALFKPENEAGVRAQGAVSKKEQDQQTRMAPAQEKKTSPFFLWGKGLGKGGKTCSRKGEKEKHIAIKKPFTKDQRRGSQFP